MALLLPVADGFVAAPPLMVEVQRGVAAVKFRMVAGMVQAAAGEQRIADATRGLPRARHLPRSRVAITPEPQRLAEAALPPAPVQPQTDSAAAAPPPAPVSAVSNVTPAASVAVRDVVVALYPQGDGDPDSITCRSPEALPGSRLPGPKVCQTNRQWARLRARHQDIGPDGQNIILPDGSERHAGYAVLNCARSRISGASGYANNLLSAPASFCF